MKNLHLRLPLWICTGLLCSIGMVMVISTTAGMGVEEVELNLRFITRQLAALLVGFFGAAVLSRLGTDWLRQRWVIVAVAGGLLALLAATPLIGVSVNGATRWVSLGPVRLQPAELAKLGFIVVMAWYLVVVEERVRVTWHGVLLPLAGFVVLAALIYRTRDLGSVIVIAGLLWFLLFYAGANWLYTTCMGILAAPLALYVTVFQSSYRYDRIMAFLDPMNQEIAATYHLRQSFIAIGTGGSWGVGLGQGPSKNAFLPERHTDFIYAIVCEELGLLGALGVAALFLGLVVIGFVIAAKTDDRHRRLLAVGLTALLGIQAFWNMFVVVGLLPTKGLTLPFISYGGSSLVVCLLCIGLLDAVARQCPQRQTVRVGATSRLGAVPVERPRPRRRPTEGVL